MTTSPPPEPDKQDEERVPLSPGLIALGVLAVVIGVGFGLLLSTASLVR